MKAKSKLPQLWVCVLLDLIGMASYFVPVWSEWIDVVWAPMAAFIFYLLFGGKTGTIGAAITFAEEALPFIDIVPMFTIGYFARKAEIKKTLT